MASIKQYDGSWRATVKRKGHGVFGQARPDQGRSGAMGRGKHFPENMKERGVNNKKTNKWIKFIGMKMKKSDASDEPTTPIHISF